MQRATAVRPDEGNDWLESAPQRAVKAMDACDLVALQRVVAQHPLLLQSAAQRDRGKFTLIDAAIDCERKIGRGAFAPIMQWLEEQGEDLQRALNVRLCGHMYMQTDDVRYWLERGADASWVAPNGLSVLEHALIRYWNGEAARLVAERTTVPDALWVAAGLGDVNSVRRFLDDKGKPTQAAHRHRAPLDAVGPGNLPSLADADADELLMEAFWVAAINGRGEVLEYMASRGFNVDTLIWNAPLINIAVGNGWTSTVEGLVRAGANLDIAGDSNGTARHIARSRWVSGTVAPTYRRIVELCELDPDAIVAELNALPHATPVVSSRLQGALELASDDAVRQGASAISAEHLLFGLIRFGKMPFTYFIRVSEMDRERFHADVRARAGFAHERVSHVMLPLATDAQLMLAHATALAAARRRETVEGTHLLYALIDAESGPAADILARYGSSAAKLKERMRREALGIG